MTAFSTGMSTGYRKTSARVGVYQPQLFDPQSLIREDARRSARFWLNAAPSALQAVVLVLVAETEARRRAQADRNVIQFTDTDNLDLVDLWAGDLCLPRTGLLLPPAYTAFP